MIKRNGYIMIDLILVLILVTGMSVVAYSSISSTPNSVSDDLLKNQALTIDGAILDYYQSQGKKYPPDLATLQNQYLLPSTYSLDAFSYITPSGQLKYRLTVNLSSGETYTSPYSNY